MYYLSLSADVDVADDVDLLTAFRAVSLLWACELEPYGEYFFFGSESFFICFSILLLSVSSRVSLGSLND